MILSWDGHWSSSFVDSYSGQSLNPTQLDTPLYIRTYTYSHREGWGGEVLNQREGERDKGESTNHKAG